MTPANSFRAGALPDAMRAASRRLWLAGLGAAVVTRDWADKEAGTVFRKLVREGTVVESRAFRAVGERIDASFSQASALWRHARRTLNTTAQSLADATTSLVRQAIPASRPGASLQGASGPAAKRTAKRTAKRSRKAAPASASTRRAGSAKRAVKRG